MITLITVASFYTPDLYFRSRASRLIDNCDYMGVPHYIVERNYGSTWIDNVRAKPKFLLEAQQVLQADFIWLDVDCKILKPLDFTMSQWGVYLRGDKQPHDYVHYVPKTSRPFLEQWLAHTARLGQGSHSAFIDLAPPYQVMPPGYFELGISSTRSKFDYLRTIER